MAALYWDVVSDMANVWWTDPAYSHGLLIPPLALYVAYIQKEYILATPARPSAAGLWLTALGCMVLVIGKLGAEFFLTRESLVVILAGIVLTYWGWDRLWRVAFPLVLLATMVPLPTILYNKMAAPLQLFSSWVASETLDAMGVPVFRDGNVMHLPEISLGVAEACSGLRSLSSLTVLALVVGFFVLSTAWGKALLFFLSFPAAIAINVVRVTATALMAREDPRLAEGFFHSFSGWIVFLVGFGLLYAVATGISYLEGSPNNPDPETA
ncbi:MAG: exosortase [Acidobacteria bacterium]|nr:exosortase [Acidobacteriota bacterium]